MGSRHEQTLLVTLGPSQRRPIDSVGYVQLACPLGTRLLEPSLGRLRMPTRNRGKYNYVVPSHGTRQSQAKSYARVHTSSRAPIGSFFLYFSREGLDKEVPPMKPTMEAFERTACLQRNRLGFGLVTLLLSTGFGLMTLLLSTGFGLVTLLLSTGFGLVTFTAFYGLRPSDFYWFLWVSA
ncbi:hypothetical protein CRG98_046270 [Punica granatum]|uniref:Uncharacterized protein n=1 Tax=Punica granatum TaxID=22663 RepID=A0A2I0HNN8_PUNGR|nr:hypothetical protein CRG98_046270 [Punica granatum]